MRVAVLGFDTVAASNHDDAMVIRGMVDRSRKLASPFGGPALLRRYYKRVQFSSPAWFVAHIPVATDAGSWGSIFTQPADLVISVSYFPLYLPLRTGALHFRSEAITGSNSDARIATEKLNTFLALFHGAENSAGSHGNDPDVKAVFDSLQVRQEDDRAVLSAIVPPSFLKKLLAEAPAEMPASTLAPAIPEVQVQTPGGSSSQNKSSKNAAPAGAKNKAKP